MRRITTLLVCVTFAANVTASEAAANLPSSGLSRMPSVAKNQKRPQRVAVACFDEDGNPAVCNDDPTGGGSWQHGVCNCQRVCNIQCKPVTGTSACKSQSNYGPNGYCETCTVPATCP